MQNNFFFLFFIGFFVGYLNFIGLKLTIKKFVKEKKIYIISCSLILRLICICSIFYIFLNKNWKNAIMMVFGFVVAKYFIILIDKIKEKRK